MKIIESWQVVQHMNCSCSRQRRVAGWIYCKGQISIEPGGVWNWVVSDTYLTIWVGIPNPYNLRVFPFPLDSWFFSSCNSQCCEIYIKHSTISATWLYHKLTWQLGHLTHTISFWVEYKVERFSEVLTNQIRDVLAIKGDEGRSGPRGEGRGGWEGGRREQQQKWPTTWASQGSPIERKREGQRGGGHHGWRFMDHKDVHI